MKTFIIMLSVVVSANVFAKQPQSVHATSAITMIMTLTSSGMKPFGKAQEIVMNVNEYHQSGVLSLELAQQVEDIQSLHDVSEEEAIDMLSVIAEDILESK